MTHDEHYHLSLAEAWGEPWERPLWHYPLPSQERRRPVPTVALQPGAVLASTYYSVRCPSATSRVVPSLNPSSNSALVTGEWSLKSRRKLKCPRHCHISQPPACCGRLFPVFCSESAACRATFVPPLPPGIFKLVAINLPYHVEEKHMIFLEASFLPPAHDIFGIDLQAFCRLRMIFFGIDLWVWCVWSDESWSRSHKASVRIPTWGLRWVNCHDPDSSLFFLKKFPMGLIFSKVLFSN